MTLSAGRLNVACGQHGLLPRQRAVVGFLDVVAAPWPRWHITHPNSVQYAESLGACRNGCVPDVRQAGFFKPSGRWCSGPTTPSSGMPDLLNAALETPLQRDGIAAPANQPQYAF